MEGLQATLQVHFWAVLSSRKVKGDSVLIERNAIKTRKRLIQEGSDLILEKAINIAGTDEISKAQMESNWHAKMQLLLV